MIDHVHVGHPKAAKVGSKLRVLFTNPLIGSTHIIENTVRRKPDPGSRSTDGADDRLCHIKGKAVAAGCIAAVVIVPSV